jgi:hypothetical protein
VALKTEARVVGFDDAPFTRSSKRVDVVGIVMRGGAYVEAVLHTDVGRDGDDATDRLAAAVQAYAGRRNLAAILLQNVMVAGFNVVDLGALHEATRLPVIAVARGRPDLDAVRAALASPSIPNGAAKWQRIEAVVPLMRGLDHGRITVTAVGLPAAAAEQVVRLTTVRGAMPEPLRLAHLVGAGWVLGASKGS